jgi:hypothetical protein
MKNTLQTKAENRIPADAVLLIPDAEEGQKPTCGVKPGYYNKPQMLTLLAKHKSNADAIQFIADMLETGDTEIDGFAVMLRNARNNPEALTRIITLCK